MLLLYSALVTLRIGPLLVLASVSNLLGLPVLELNLDVTSIRLFDFLLGAVACSVLLLVALALVALIAASAAPLIAITLSVFPHLVFQ